jgi:hypothetical protein
MRTYRSARLRRRGPAHPGMARPRRCRALARVGSPHRVGAPVAAREARTDITGRLPDQEDGAHDVPHVGVGAATPLGMVGGFPCLRFDYDHRFEASDPTSTWLEWLVTLRGPISPLIRGVFTRVYERNLDRAIPRLQEWFRDRS